MIMLFMDDFEGMTREDAIDKIASDYQVETSEVEKYDLIILWQDGGVGKVLLGFF
jgi:hypothetical protein